MRSALAATFAVIATLVAGGVTSIYWIGGRTIAREKEVANRLSAIDRLNMVLSTLKDAETGQRGYLLTQNESYLAPLESAQGRIDEDLAWLLRSLSDSEQSRLDFTALLLLSSQKLNELGKTVDLARAGHLDQALEILRTSKGKELMDQIRARAAHIEQQEQRSVQAAERALQRANVQRDTVFLVVALVNLVFIGWAYRRIRHETIVRSNSLTEIERQKDLLNVTLLSIGDAVIITDVQGRIVLMNKVAEELTGWPFEEAKSMRCEAIFQIINEESRQVLESPVIKVMREGVIVGLANHTLLVRRDGSEIPIDDSGAPIREANGNLRGVVLVFRDFSEYKSTEKSLRAAKDELDVANRAKDQFFAALSHELRTPLTPVLATLSFWEADKSFPESLRGDIKMMRRNIKLEMRLVDELIDLNRVTKGKISLKLETVDVHTLISSVLKMYGSEITSRCLDITTDLVAEDCYVNCDSDRLQQVFWNIIKNAAFFTPKGGNIHIRTFNIASSICIAFKDTGIGMSPETMQNLFKPFDGKTPANSPPSEGLGLGLSISRALIVQQGGEITAKSDGIGSGSEFVIRLPSAQAPPGPVVLPMAPTATMEAPIGRLRILLVEDHVDSAYVLSKSLTLSGYEVDTAGTSASALELYRGNQYDLVLSDIGLPDGSGIDLVQKMKEIKDVPAIALTGFGTEEDMLLSEQTGFILHLTKPVDIQHLQAAIQRFGKG
jgi:PAS domain S-box-containing protein